MLEFILAVLILAGVAAYARFLWKRRKQRKARSGASTGWHGSPREDDTARRNLP